MKCDMCKAEAVYLISLERHSPYILAWEKRYACEKHIEMVRESENGRIAAFADMCGVTQEGMGILTVVRI